MNRLWVRLSALISGTLFLVFFVQFLSITLDQGGPPGGVLNDGDFRAPDRAEITRRLGNFALLSAGIGLGSGILIARLISKPVSDLAGAAHRIGQGERGARIPARGSHEIVELTEAFNKMAGDLERAETLRNNLMADVSHELRTPLTVLEGNLRAALDHVVVLDDAGVANLYGQTRHLIRLVGDLRELALAETRALTLDRQPTDIGALIGETIQALEPLAAEKGVAITSDAGDLPPARVDAGRIRQALINLLSNALRHTPAGGKIVVRASARGDELRLSVADNGDGLRPELLERVFDRFYRADESRSRETGGTGLGLAIVKAIAEAHGGRAEASSDGPGKGCAFSLTLPIA
jgi:two-component system OmpR family sensor kinase/two-component system sensor histidine kinase BaeS